MTEEWRPIPGLAGYEASSEGRIRSRWIVGGAHNRGRRMGSSWRVLKGSVNAHGYRFVGLLDGDTTVSVSVHGLIATVFHGPRPEGLEVRHLNGQQLDNRAANLRWGTRSEQQLDRVRHGTHHNVNKTHCKRGHPYSPDNTYIIPSSGSRMCRTCQRLRQQAERLRSAGLAS